MSIPKGHEPEQGRRSVRSFVRSHRKIIGLMAIVLLSGAVVMPYTSANTAADHSQSGQPADATPASVMSTLEEKNEMPQDTSANSNTNQTQVTVNGQTVDVPTNGNYHNVTEDADGRTEIKVDSSQHSSGGNSSNSSSSTVNINVNSQSQSDSSSD